MATALADMRTQAITGIVPPQVSEAMISSRWPSLAVFGPPARLSQAMQLACRQLFRATISLPLPLAWLLTVPVTLLCLFIALPAWAMLLPFFALRILPGFGRRYVVTNQRVMIQKDTFTRRLAPSQEVKLSEMGGVRVVAGTVNDFFDSADLEIVDDAGKRLLLLPAVAEYATFQRCIEDAWKAWARKMPSEQTLPASSLK